MQLYHYATFANHHDQINKQHIDTCSKEIGLCLQIMLSTPHSTVSTMERTSLFNQEINKHTLPITIIKLGKLLIFNPVFVMLHHDFASAIRVTLYKSNRQKSENVKTNQIKFTCLTKVRIPQNSNLCTSSISIH